jgi:hypothetical protein
VGGDAGGGGGGAATHGQIGSHQRADLLSITITNRGNPTRETTIVATARTKTPTCDGPKHSRESSVARTNGASAAMRTQ